MFGTDKYIFITALVLALSACTRPNPAPPSWQTSMKEAQKTPRGAWIQLELTEQRTVYGELLAIHEGRIHVLTPSGIVAVNVAEVGKAELAVYEGEKAPIVVTGVLGTLSTLSHGAFLIFTAPIWIISSAVVTRLQSGVGYEEFENSSSPARRSTPSTLPPGAGNQDSSTAGADSQSFIDKLRPYARFPQGLPPVLAMPRGTGGGLCYGNHTCSGKARCDVERDVCVPDETIGTQGGACYPDGACDPGLTCDATTTRCALPAPPPAPPPAEVPDAGADATAP